MCPRAPRAPALRLLALGALLWPAADSWELTILHTNDVHSRLEQTSEDSSKCVNASSCVGGVARLYTKVQQIRSSEPHVLLLDAGDQYQGTIWFTVYKGAEVAHFMNALRYDAMVSRQPAREAWEHRGRVRTQREVGMEEQPIAWQRGASLGPGAIWGESKTLWPMGHVDADTEISWMMCLKRTDVVGPPLGNGMFKRTEPSPAYEGVPLGCVGALATIQR